MMKKLLQMLVFSALGLVALPRTADACGTIHDDGMLAVNRCLGSGPSNQKARELEILRQRARPHP